MKRFEKAIAAKIGRSTIFLNPSQYTPRDGFGNVSGPFIVKMLSVLKAFSESGYRANITDRSKARQLKRGTYQDFIVIPIGDRSGRKPGIYQRLGVGQFKRLRPIFFMSTRSHTYSKRYDMIGIVESVRDKHFGAEFNRAMDQALASAKLTIR